MITNAYTLYDRKALQYHVPFFAPADGAAVRMVVDLASDQNTTVGRHPEDYVLYRCGAYDDASGSLLPVTALNHIADVSSLVRLTTDGPYAQLNGSALPPALPVND